MTLKKPFGPRNEKEARTFAEENFRIDVQMLIHELMEQKHINQRELADLLGVSESRVSQFFTDRFNMTVRKLAGVFHVLGERPVISVDRKGAGAVGTAERTLGGVTVEPRGVRALPTAPPAIFLGAKFEDPLWGSFTLEHVVPSSINQTQRSVLPARQLIEGFEDADKADDPAVNANDPRLDRAA
jgi:predicted XRE-type DNA-binding protein